MSSKSCETCQYWDKGLLAKRKSCYMRLKWRQSVRCFTGGGVSDEDFRLPILGYLGSFNQRMATYIPLDREIRNLKSISKAMGKRLSDEIRRKFEGVEKLTHLEIDGIEKTNIYSVLIKPALHVIDRLNALLCALEEANARIERKTESIQGASYWLKKSIEDAAENFEKNKWACPII